MHIKVVKETKQEACRIMDLVREKQKIYARRYWLWVVC